MKNRKVIQLPILVSVIKCSRKTYWYGDIVGENRYVVDSNNEDKYSVVSIRTTASVFNITRTRFMLDKADCVIREKL